MSLPHFIKPSYFSLIMLALSMIPQGLAQQTNGASTDYSGNPKETTEKRLPAPKRERIQPPSQEALDAQIDKGVRFMLNTQNKDGSWGDHGMTKGLNVLCPLPGGPIAFQAAVTGLSVIGLSSAAPNRPEVQEALDKAQTWLLAELPKIKRTSEDTLLNVWAHSYGIRALCMLAERVSPESETYQQLKAECETQIKRLMDMAYAGGGWGYYEFGTTNAVPQGSATSFCTSTVLLALKDAENTFGLMPDEKILRRSIKFLYNQRTPDGTYVYSMDHMRAPHGYINRYAGSLARNVAGNAALYAYKHPKITKDVMEDSLEWLWAQKGWIDTARKKPIPHEGFAQNAGYFFYYGYFYAAQNINLLDPEKKERHSAFLSTTLLPLQEKDGSWWDYPLYNYHKPYGTGYALYSLSTVREFLYGSKFPTE